MYAEGDGDAGGACSAEVSRLIVEAAGSWTDVILGRGAFASLSGNDPRRGVDANLHRRFLLMSPAEYRKTSAEHRSALRAELEGSGDARDLRSLALVGEKLARSASPPTGRSDRAARSMNIDDGMMVEAALASNAERIALLLPEEHPDRKVFLALAAAGAERASFRVRHAEFNGLAAPLAARRGAFYPEVLEELERAGRIGAGDPRLSRIGVGQVGLSMLSGVDFIRNASEEIRSTLKELRGPALGVGEKKTLQKPLLRYSQALARRAGKSAGDRAAEIFGSVAELAETLAMLKHGRGQSLRDLTPMLAIAEVASRRELMVLHRDALNYKGREAGRASAGATAAAPEHVTPDCARRSARSRDRGGEAR